MKQLNISPPSSAYHLQLSGSGLFSPLSTSAASDGSSNPVPAFLLILSALKCSLQTLDLNINALSGTLPYDLPDMGQLWRLNLAHNAISGRWDDSIM